MTQYVVSVNHGLDVGAIDTYEDVFADLIAAQNEAQGRASEGYGETIHYVHEITTRPVFKAQGIRTVATEVM